MRLDIPCEIYIYISLHQFSTFTTKQRIDSILSSLTHIDYFSNNQTGGLNDHNKPKTASSKNRRLNRNQNKGV